MNQPISQVPSSLIRYAHLLFWPGLAVYVFTLPISHTIAIRNIAFLVLILATLCLYVAIRQKPTLPLKGAWAIYTGVALISCLYAVSPMDSFTEIRVEIFYCITIFMIAVTWSKHDYILPSLAFIAAASNLILVVVAISMAGFDKSWDDILTLPGWARAGFNANYLLTMTPFLFYMAWAQWNKENRLRSVAIVLLLMIDLVAMMLSYNRQALFALAAGILCAGTLLLNEKFTWKRCTVFFGIVFILAGLLAVQMVRRSGTNEGVEKIAHTAISQDVRWPLWKFSLEKITDHPLTGGGFGRAVFDKLYPDFMPDNTMLWHAHNMILNKGIQMGIPGMLAFLLLWLALLRSFTRHLRGSPGERAIAIAGISTLATIFMKNMTDDFFVRDMALWFWLITGMLLGSLQRQALGVEAPRRPQ